MEGFGEIFKAIGEHPTAALLAVALLALAWLMRAWLKRDAEHRAEIADAHKAHLETAMQVAPLASKLVTCVEVLERLSARAP